MKKIFFYLLIALSAVLFSLSFPSQISEGGIHFLGTFALVPLFISILNLNTKREIFFAGAIFGILHTVLSYLWLANYGEYSAWTWGGISISYLFIFGTLFLLFIIIKKSFARKHIALGFAILFVLFEYFKSNIGLLSFPWILNAQIFYNFDALLQIADIFGIWFISFLIIYPQSIIASLIDGIIKKEKFIFTHAMHFVTFLTLLAITLGYGFYSIKKYSKEEGSELKTLLIQANTDPWSPDPIAPLKTNMNLTREWLQNSKEKPDLVVWSETSLLYPYFKGPVNNFYKVNPSENDSFISFIKNLNTNFLSGAYFVSTKDDSEKDFNAAIMLDQQAQIIDYYAKKHLVIFAEYVPLIDNPIISKIFNKIGVYSSWAIGDVDTIFKIKNSNGEEIAFGTPICFEDSFPNIGRRMVKNGAHALLNLTNNSWSKRNYAQVQHYVAAKFRAIENRIPIVRTSNSGLTGYISRTGVLLKESPMFKETSLYLKVMIPKEVKPTIYNKFGDFIIIIFLILLLFFAKVKRNK